MVKEETKQCASEKTIKFNSLSGEKFWEKSLAQAKKNRNYSKAIEFATLWANYMQGLIENQKKKLTEVADDTYTEVCIMLGITNTNDCFKMLIVQLLGMSWFYNKELLNWLNGQNGYCGGGLCFPHSQA